MIFKKGLSILLLLMFIIFSFIGCNNDAQTSFVEDLEGEGYILIQQDDEYIERMKNVSTYYTYVEAEYAVLDSDEMMAASIMVFTSNRTAKNFEDSMSFQESETIFRKIYNNLYIAGPDNRVIEIITGDTTD